MAMAFLGFPEGGPSLHFRINPEAVEWSFKIHTRVFHTIGGRVIQVIGGALSDLVIDGSIGEDFNVKNHEGEFRGESWRMHEHFVNKVREMMEWQSRDAIIQMNHSALMHEPAKFIYGPKGWNFTVYIKSIEDPSGGSISHVVGRANHKYRLTLFIVEDSSSSITKITSQAINDYIDRISHGIGWQYSDFNGEGWENLDPYGDQWGEALDLSAITGEAGGGGISGDGSIRGNEDPDAPGGGVIPSGGNNAGNNSSGGGGGGRNAFF